MKARLASQKQHVHAWYRLGEQGKSGWQRSLYAGVVYEVIRGLRMRFGWAERKILNWLSHSQIQAGWIIQADPAKPNGPQHSDLVSEDRMINPTSVGQTSACIPKSHIQWFPLLLLQSRHKRKSRVFCCYYCYSLWLSQKIAKPDLLDKCVFFFWQKEFAKNLWGLCRMSNHQGQVTSTLTTAGVTDSWSCGEQDKPPDALTSHSGHTGPLNKQYGVPPPPSPLPALWAKGHWSSTLQSCLCRVASHVPSHVSSCWVCFPSISLSYRPLCVSMNRETGRPAMLSLILPCLFCSSFFFFHLFSQNVVAKKKKVVSTFRQNIPWRPTACRFDSDYPFNYTYVTTNRECGAQRSFQKVHRGAFRDTPQPQEKKTWDGSKWVLWDNLQATPPPNHRHAALTGNGCTKTTTKYRGRE